MKALNPQLYFELLERVHPQLLLALVDADHYCRLKFNKHILLTSLIRSKTNDSGVHAAGRGGDLRVKDPATNEWYFTTEQQIEICKYLNKKYVYGKGKLTAMIHNHGDKIIKPTIDSPLFSSPTSTAPHIHIQVPE